MCRIEEKVYISPDGHRSTYDDTFLCERGRRYGRTCSDARIRRTEYNTAASSRDPNSSPFSSSPVTPSGPGYQTRTRRPSTSGGRPPTKDGPVTLKPEIVIEIGSKKGNGKSYPTVSISTTKNHRTSMGSNAAIDSPDSDASHTVRTGYPDTSLPLGSGYVPAGGLHPRPGYYGNPSSDESYTGSSHIPSLYRTSDGYDTPSLATTTSSGTRPIIHNGPRVNVSPPIHTVRGQSSSPSSPYRTTVVTPRGVSDESTGAPEIIGRGEDRERRRRESRRQQEALDAEVAANEVREENRRVRFETSRAQDRAEQRAEKTSAGRADERERLRQKEKKEREAREAREAAGRRPKPSADISKPTTPSRRNSVRMTSAEVATQQQLLAAEQRQMQSERITAEALERQENMQQAPTLQQQQQDPRYYDPRGGSTNMPGGPGSVVRRGSSSGSTARPDLSRSSSKRGAGTTQPRQDRRQPPVSFYNGNSNARTELPLTRERRPSSSQGERPFNPFAQPAPTQAADPWDYRNIRDALPNPREAQGAYGGPQQATNRLSRAFYDGKHEKDPYR